MCVCARVRDRSAGLLIIVEHNVLRQRRVVVGVHEILADTDAGEAGGKQAADYLHPRGGIVSRDIHGPAAGVRAVTAAPLRKVPRLRTVCAIQLERYPGQIAGPVQTVHRRLVHILQGAGRYAPLELPF